MVAALFMQKWRDNMNSANPMASSNVSKQPEKGINLRIQECKEDIANVINASQLPPGIILMVLNEFVGQVQAQNIKMIETERKAYEEGEKTDGKEIHKN
jgi:hypothetical protein